MPNATIDTCNYIFKCTRWRHFGVEFLRFLALACCSIHDEHVTWRTGDGEQRTWELYWSHRKHKWSDTILLGLHRTVWSIPRTSSPCNFSVGSSVIWIKGRKRDLTPELSQHEQGQERWRHKDWRLHIFKWFLVQLCREKVKSFDVRHHDNGGVGHSFDLPNKQ